MARCVCLLILYCLVPIVVSGQEVEIKEVRYTRSTNVTADNRYEGVISFKIFPEFIKGIIFKSRMSKINNIKSNPENQEYSFSLPPINREQILTITGYGFSEEITVERVDSSSYREYHLNWLSNHFVDSIVSIKAQGIQDSVLQIYRDSIRKIYQDSIFRTFQKPKKPLIKDWSRDFKLIVGVSNGIVAGEFGGGYVELKFGKKTGFALECGYGLGPEKTNDARWSGGVKGYYKYWFLSTHYGTTTVVMNRNSSFRMNDDGSYLLEGRRTSHRKGITMLCGYDRNWKWLHFTAGMGATLTTSNNPKFLPAWNIGVGISLTDLFAN